MKSRSPQAMLELISTIQSNIPFDDMTEARLCGGLCQGCPKKLLEYLEQEIEWWQSEVKNGATPSLGDVEKLARSSRKIYSVLKKNEVL